MCVPVHKKEKRKKKKKDHVRTFKRYCGPCQSLVDYGNVKINWHALNT